MELLSNLFPQCLPNAIPTSELNYLRVDHYMGVFGAYHTLAVTPYDEIEHNKCALFKTSDISDDLMESLQKSNSKLTLVALYSPNQQPPFLVPTGKVFIRLEPSASIKDVTLIINQKGFKLLQLAPYSTNAGWLEAGSKASNQIALALNNFSKLATLPHLVRAELQFLQAAQMKI